MKWSDAKRELQQLESRELFLLLKQLFDLSPANRTFFEASLLPGNKVPLKHYKKEISSAVNPSTNSEIDLQRGRKAISEFKKAAPDELICRLDLMLFFVEEAASQTLKYGTINGRFYDSMCRMLDSIVELTNQLHPVEYLEITDRFRKLDAATSGNIGWGVCDHISDTLAELEGRYNDLDVSSDCAG